jgi:hypothetical protein
VRDGDTDGDTEGLGRWGERMHGWLS